jgi:hypothetical protein
MVKCEICVECIESYMIRKIRMIMNYDRFIHYLAAIFEVQRVYSVECENLLPLMV